MASLCELPAVRLPLQVLLHTNCSDQMYRNTGNRKLYDMDLVWLRRSSSSGSSTRRGVGAAEEEGGAAVTAVGEGAAAVV